VQCATCNPDTVIDGDRRQALAHVLQIEASVIPKTAMVKAELSEHSPFLDWARQQQKAHRHGGSAPTCDLPGDASTQNMYSRRHFRRHIDEEQEDQTHWGVGATCMRKGRRAVAAYVHATPSHLAWSSDLHSSSRMVQEQVNVAIAATKHIREAESQIRPLCRVPV
jgi:hypothetical protein